MTDLSNKTVLITGAAKGIGRLLAERIAGKGEHLVLWDIDEDALNQLRVEFLEKNYSVQIAVCNISDRNELRSTATKLVEGE